jgi:hypothetical protein
MVMLGTKCPSITSTWITSAPAFSTALTSSARRLKSADKIEGAIFFTDALLFYKRISLIPILKNSKPFFNKNFSEPPIFISQSSYVSFNLLLIPLTPYLLIFFFTIHSLSALLQRNHPSHLWGERF